MKALNAKGIVHRDLKPQVSGLFWHCQFGKVFRQLNNRKAGKSESFSLVWLCPVYRGSPLFDGALCDFAPLAAHLVDLLTALCLFAPHFYFWLSIFANLTLFCLFFSFSPCLPITVTNCHTTIRTYCCAISRPRRRTMSLRRPRRFAWRSPISGLPVFSKTASWRLRSAAHRCTWLLKVRTHYLLVFCWAPCFAPKLGCCSQPVDWPAAPLPPLDGTWLMIEKWWCMMCLKDDDLVFSLSDSKYCGWPSMIACSSLRGYHQQQQAPHQAITGGRLSFWVFLIQPSYAIPTCCVLCCIVLPFAQKCAPMRETCSFQICCTTCTWDETQDKCSRLS